ncbi:presenilins-associated rhomboid-like protein, mitochondrial [Corythoichthys intestinalis]|uniref:presenilins-associated rhomboid-like protein, mitochondrial n=1 Tax=Corythoichthys intestinalis TaxID=161448 RepID=UPI0025A5C637|nr:presenilins-associated rhomboid-like protein, mitochondrial [Corythoichthys intestinalis]XP_061795067.1 presenilin-associated rhomboid-like protein A, mitochondrial [Nerophis lumbriciformis]
MAWRSYIVKWTQTSLISPKNATRLDLYCQTKRGFRRDAKRPETKKGNVTKETHANTSPPESPQGPPPQPQRVPRPKLLKPFLFTVGFTGCSFCAAAILQYENQKSRVRTLRDDESDKLLQGSTDMVYWHDWWNKLTDFQRQLILLMSVADDFWSSLTEGQRTVSGIILANAVVLCCWKIPSLRRSMLKYFISNPASKSQCLPMILSPFSHFSVLHFLANMYVLWTFSSGIVSLLGREQFLAVYMSAGVISNMLSYLCKTTSGRIFPSLGASGAVMAVVAALFATVPEAKLNLIFLPMISLTAGNALKTLVAIDVTGLLMGWRVFDHASHIGGALFGVWYVAYGHKLIWGKRDTVVEMWRKIRTPGGGGARPGGGPENNPKGGPHRPN